MVIIFTTILLLLFTRLITVFYLNKKGRTYTDGDAIGHLNYIKEIYENNGKIQEKIEKYLLDYNDYPNGFHKLVYLLKMPLNFIERFGGYLPTFLDLGLLLFTILFINIFGGENYYWLLTFPLLRMFISNDGRSSHFSERAYGVLWGNIFLGSMVAYYIQPDIIWLISAAVSFLIFSISSKFSWQATCFITILLSLFEQSIFFIGFYISTFILSIILSRGYSLKILKGLIRHSFFYKKYLSIRYFNLPNHYKNFFNTFKVSGLHKKLMLFLTNSVFKFISDNPLNLGILFLILAQGEWGIFHSWALTGMALLFLIALEPLKFLGEPERYLEFSIIPTFVILSTSSIPYPISVIIITTIVVLYLLHYVLFIRNYKNKHVTSHDMEDLLSFFTSKEAHKTILTIPLRLSFFLGYFTKNYKFVTLLSNIGMNTEQENYKNLIPDYYPFPGGNLSSYIKQYKINYIVTDKERIRIFETSIDNKYYTLDNYNIVHENNSYVVYEVSK